MALLKKTDPSLEARLSAAQGSKADAFAEFERAANALVAASDDLLVVASEARAEADRLAELATKAEADADHSERVAGRLRDLLA